MMITPTQFFLIIVAGWINREQQKVIAYLQEEVRVLRSHVPNKRLPLTDAQRKRLAVKAKAVGRNSLFGIGCIVTPDTLMRWYRRLVAKKYDGSKKRRVGRPTTKKEIAKLVVRMAKENVEWGYTRILGAHANLGHTIGRTTVKRILLDHGLDPAPLRSKGLSWREFWRRHWDQIAAADFFTIEVMTLKGLVRYHVFFVMELATRKVEVVGLAGY